MIINRRSSKVEIVLAVLLSALLAVCLGVWTWGLNRGFDISDEGMYLLQVQEGTISGATRYALFLSLITGGSSEGLIFKLRMLQLVSQIVGQTILFFCFVRRFYANDKNHSFCQLLVVWLLSLLGGMGLLAVFPPSMSYNGLAQFLIFAAAGLVLYATTIRGWLRVLTCSLASIFAAGLLFVKIPCSPLLFAMCVFWLVVEKLERKYVVLYAATFIITAFLLACFFFGIESTQEYVSVIQQFVANRSSSNQHSPASMLATNINDFYYCANLASQAFKLLLILPAIYFIAMYVLLPKISSVAVQRLMVFALWPVVLIAAVSFGSLNASLWASYPAFYVWLLLVALTLAGTEILSRRQLSNRDAEKKVSDPGKFWAMAMVIMLPLVYYAGSCNPILLQCYTASAPLWLVLGSLGFARADQRKAEFYRSTVFALSGLFLSFQFIYGYVHQPYLLYGGKIAQSMKADDLPNLKGILLDEESHQFLLSVYNLLKDNGFRPGEPILALYNLPGVVYASGGNSPVTAWWMPRPEFRAANVAAIGRLGKVRKKPLYLLLSWYPGQATIKALNDAGIDFPHGFKLVGSTKMQPYVDGCRDLKDADARYLNGAVQVFKEM